MYAKLSETVVVPKWMDETYLLVRKCLEGVDYYAVEHPVTGEALYTPDPTATGAVLAGKGYTPDDFAMPHGILLVLMIEVDEEKLIDYHPHSTVLLLSDPIRYQQGF